MEGLAHKLANRQRRKTRVRSVISGNAIRPRLAVHVSLRHVTAQLIDDDKRQTIVYSTTVGQKGLANNLTKRAQWVGRDIAKKAQSKKLSNAVFDRSIRLYHGRVAALADAARDEGLKI